MAVLHGQAMTPPALATMPSTWGDTPSPGIRYPDDSQPLCVSMCGGGQRSPSITEAQNDQLQKAGYATVVPEPARALTLVQRYQHERHAFDMWRQYGHRPPDMVCTHTGSEGMNTSDAAGVAPSLPRGKPAARGILSRWSFTVPTYAKRILGVCHTIANRLASPPQHTIGEAPSVRVAAEAGPPNFSPSLLTGGSQHETRPFSNRARSPPSSPSSSLSEGTSAEGSDVLPRSPSNSMEASAPALSLSWVRGVWRDLPSSHRPSPATLPTAASSSLIPLSLSTSVTGMSAFMRGLRRSLGNAARRRRLRTPRPKGPSMWGERSIRRRVANVVLSAWERPLTQMSTLTSAATAASPYGKVDTSSSATSLPDSSAGAARALQLRCTPSSTSPPATPKGSTQSPYLPLLVSLSSRPADDDSVLDRLTRSLHSVAEHAGLCESRGAVECSSPGAGLTGIPHSAALPHDGPCCYAPLLGGSSLWTPRRTLHVNPVAPPLTSDATVLSSWREEYRQVLDDAEAMAAQRDGSVPLRSSEEASRYLASGTDGAVRAVYNAVCDDVISAMARNEVETQLETLNGAASRAASEWLLREAVRTVVSYSSNGDHPVPSPCLFYGVLKHIREGQAVSLSALVLDTEDLSVMETVRRRESSDSSAISFPETGLNLSFRHLASLLPNRWLNDNIINGYLHMLCDEQKKRHPHEKEVVVNLGSHFYVKVEEELQRLAGHVRWGDDNNEALTHLRLPAQSPLLRWLRRRTSVLLPYQPDATGDGSAVGLSALAPATTTIRTVLVPINLSGNHWALAVLDKTQRTWFYYDSLTRGPRDTRGSRILSHLDFVMRECYRHLLGDGTSTVPPCGKIVALPYTPSCAIDAVPAAVLTDAPRWGVHDSRSGIRCMTVGELQVRPEEVELHAGGFDKVPQQTNGDDCGVFLCAVAWCVSQGVAVCFAQSEIPQLRQVMLLELWSQRLAKRLPGTYSSSSADVSVWQ